MAPSIPRDGTPFVLLDDARTRGAATARLYVDPVQVVTTRKMADVRQALVALRTASQGGLAVAGYFAYEAGYALEPKLLNSAPPTSETPLLWFGLFRTFAEIDAAQVPLLLPDPAGSWVGELRPQIDRNQYETALVKVKGLIEAGDIYQANLTFRTAVSILGSPLAIYAGLRMRARAGYGGVVNTGREWHLSLSPELFFACDGGRIRTRPMKGTAARSGNQDEDRKAAASLASDDKQRAENLMIVDLLRNDLSRVAENGSVETPELFRVETYPSVHQMTSTVTATINETVDMVDIVQALFPCGSITGAPKIRAMEAIREIERVPRGVYTGGIGRIDAGGRSGAFNVAIRTLSLSAETAHVGLGSGIVADSRADDEWNECLAKGIFIPSDRAFDLIETIAFDPNEGLLRLDAHLARMRASAELLGFAFDRHDTRNELQSATIRLRDPARVKLLLGRRGGVTVEVRPLPARPNGPIDVAILPLPVEPTDFRLRHKTSDRAFYDAARQAAGTFEVIFTDPDGLITEGSFTNIFVERDAMLLTPPSSLPILEGVLRSELLEFGRAREETLTADDLADGFFVGNALRGLLPARLVTL